MQNKTEGKPFVLATLVKTSGSSPQKVGAKMIVYSDSSISGTIGGGAFEKQVIDDSLELLRSDENHLLKKYVFKEKGEDATGMSCGGEAEVFMELHASPNRLIIFGGGHVGRDLAKVVSGLDFRITILDDRQFILNQYHPPIETILTDSEYNDNYPKIDERSYIVIVTHGHRCDRTVLSKVINFDCAYIGMIGSKTKIKRNFDSLIASGIDESLLKRVHTPIGLEIGAIGPYEIAVAIAAELIAVMRKTTQPDAI